MRRRRHFILCASQLSLAIGCGAAHAIDIHFDYTSFDNANTPGADPHFGQAQFNVVNYPSINGNYMMTSTDNHRPEMVANNNQLAEFYNFLQDRYNEQPVKNGVAAADIINQYTISNSTKNGARPDYVVLNEMSTSLWPSNATYRQWVIDVATQLHDVHGYNVVTYTTFAGAPPGPVADWQALASKSYIAVENYLSGKEVMNNGTDYASRKTWAQAQYAWSKTAYGNIGVSSSRLFLSEHYGNTLGTAGWGRAGIAAADWDTVLQIRADAILGANYGGFLAYGWGSNGMLVSEAEQLQHEYWYRTRRVLQSQQPQWLVDSAITVGGTTIPLSWNEQLNWLGGVPNASGAAANFFRTNSAARTITLDGNKTVGTLTFNSPSSYTINPGTGGSITLMSASGATLGVTSGTHTINVPLAVASTSVFSSAGTLNLNSGLSTSGAVTILRNGAGTLNIAGPQSHAAGATFVASGGTTNVNSSIGGNLSVTVNVGTTVNFNTSQNLATLTLGGGANAKLASGQRVLATTNVTSTGKLDLTDGALIARSGTIGALNGGTYSDILGMVQAGRNGGAWNGNGIYTSFTAAQGAAPLTTLATALASEALGMSTSTTATWRGQSITGNAVLIAYTYAGDANLSGTIDADDYFQINASYNDPSATRSYFKGDFNYDGQVNADDFFLIDANFHAQGLPMTGSLMAGASAIPEPAGVWLISAGLFSAARRRKV